MSRTTFAAAMLVLGAPTANAAQNIELASVNPTGENGNGDSTFPHISADGRFVTFRSYASDLIENDGSIYADIYVRDLLFQTTTRVSVDNFGIEADASSYEPILSADGRFVAFRSFATNLVPNDTNGSYDIFVYDRLASTIERASLRTNEVEGDGASSAPTISADGRFVAFHSVARNLVPNDSNNQVDIFLRDRQRGATLRVSVSSSGAQANNRSHEPSISANGRWVAFYSYASNLVSGDNNGNADIFVRDNLLQTTERVSVHTSGIQANADCIKPSISADGRFVCFESSANNLVGGDTNGVSDVFVHDRISGTTERVSIDSNNVQGLDASSEAQMSADGRFVVFQSYAKNLIAADSNESADIFLRDRVNGTTERINLTHAGLESDGYAFAPAISADGSKIAFWSEANDLTANDINGNDDVFVHTRQAASQHNQIVLVGPWQSEVGQTVALQWFAAPPHTQYALAASTNLNGMFFAGHLFEIGSPYQLLKMGTHHLAGTGSYVSPPLAANLSGTTLYFEVGALGAGATITDSIVHTVFVQ